MTCQGTARSRRPGTVSVPKRRARRRAGGAARVGWHFDQREEIAAGAAGTGGGAWTVCGRSNRARRWQGDLSGEDVDIAAHERGDRRKVRADVQRDVREGFRRSRAQQRAQRGEELGDRIPEVGVRAELGHRRVVYVRRKACRIGESGLFYKRLRALGFLFLRGAKT